MANHNGYTATSHVPIQFSPIHWCPALPVRMGHHGKTTVPSGHRSNHFVSHDRLQHILRGKPGEAIHGRKTNHFLLRDLWLYGQSLSKVPVFGGFVWLESLTNGRSLISCRNPYLDCIVDLRWKYPCSLSNCESILLFCIGIHWQPAMMGWKWAVNLATKGPKASVIFASWMRRKFKCVKCQDPSLESCSYCLKDFPQQVMWIRILSARSWCIRQTPTHQHHQNPVVNPITKPPGIVVFRFFPCIPMKSPWDPPHKLKMDSFDCWWLKIPWKSHEIPVVDV